MCFMILCRLPGFQLSFPEIGGPLQRRSCASLFISHLYLLCLCLYYISKGALFCPASGSSGYSWGEQLSRLMREEQQNRTYKGHSVWKWMAMPLCFLSGADFRLEIKYVAHNFMDKISHPNINFNLCNSESLSYLSYWTVKFRKLNRISKSRGTVEAI